MQIWLRDNLSTAKSVDLLLKIIFYGFCFVRGKGCRKNVLREGKDKKKALFLLPVQLKCQATALLVQWGGVAFNLKSPDRAHFIYFLDKTVLLVIFSHL